MCPRNWRPRWTPSRRGAIDRFRVPSIVGLGRAEGRPACHACRRCVKRDEHASRTRRSGRPTDIRNDGGAKDGPSTHESCFGVGRLHDSASSTLVCTSADQVQGSADGSSSACSGMPITDRRFWPHYQRLATRSRNLPQKWSQSSRKLHAETPRLERQRLPTSKPNRGSQCATDGLH
jgi:hypothetical protein